MGKSEENEGKGQAYRILEIYSKLNRGEIVTWKSVKDSYGISHKTFERDIQLLNDYYVQNIGCRDTEKIVVLNEDKTEACLEKSYREFLNVEEALSISKILLESRAFCEEEKEQLLSRIMALIAHEDRELVRKIIAKEKLYYVPPRHRKKLMSVIRELSEYIKEHEFIEIKYANQEGNERTHRVKPVAIMFSEFYFYLIAYMDKDSMEYPTVFRVDRIAEITDAGEKFDRIYDDSFKEGEFRKRVQFMYTGKLEHLRFEYHGKSIEAIQDRLPTAEVTPLKDGGYFVRAEVYGGEGAKMWLRSQGEWVKIL